MDGMIEFIWDTWISGGVVMFPLVLVALLIYSVAVSLLMNFRQRRFRHLKDDSLYPLINSAGSRERPRRVPGQAGS